jgi:hypothetical protein
MVMALIEIDEEALKIAAEVLGTKRAVARRRHPRRGGGGRPGPEGTRMRGTVTPSSFG